METPVSRFLEEDETMHAAEKSTLHLGQTEPNVRCAIAGVDALEEVTKDGPNLVRIVLHLGGVTKVLCCLIASLKKKQKQHIKYTKSANRERARPVWHRVGIYLLKCEKSTAL